MEFNFSSGITSASGRYEPALKLNFIGALLQYRLPDTNFCPLLGSHHEV
jgi:hypothetical protein